MSISQANLDALTAFASVADEFCTLIDSLEKGRPPDLYRKLEAILPKLHVAIIPVMTEMEEKDGDFEKVRIGHEQQQQKASVIGGVTKQERDNLVTWFRELRNESEPGDNYEYDITRAFMFWDDLADIYQDIRHGLELWKLATPNSQAAAAWQWRFNYEIHWGEHLIRAMLTVHDIRYHLFEN